MRAVSFTWAPGLETTTCPVGFVAPPAEAAWLPGAVVAAGAAGAAGIAAAVPAAVLDMALLAIWVAPAVWLDVDAVWADAAWAAAISASISLGKGGRSPGLTSTVVAGGGGGGGGGGGAATTGAGAAGWVGVVPALATAAAPGFVSPGAVV